MLKKLLLLSLATMLAVGLSAYGSSRDSASIEGEVTPAPATALGVNNCVNCHSSATPETLSWLEGAHGNSNGSMRYGDSRGPHDETSSCQPCHNQLLDGDKVDTAFTDIQIGTTDGVTPVYANVSRDIVTCESCHGGGSSHSGVGPIPYARPDWEQCVLLVMTMQKESDMLMTMACWPAT